MILFGSNEISYDYDATGIKWKKSDRNSTHMYYCSNFVYDDNGLSYILMEEGRLLPAAGGFTYEYFLRDHLGNTRVSFIATGDTLMRTQEDSYYPFGMRQGGLSYSNGVENKYLYNPEKLRFFEPLAFRGSSKNNANQRFAVFRDGKELQDDLGLDWYDMTFRMYDPALGRFMTPDPLTDLAPGISSYVYAWNNSINFNDPDGLWPWNDPATKRKKKQARTNRQRRRKAKRHAKRTSAFKSTRGNKYNPNFRKVPLWSPQPPKDRLTLISDQINLPDENIHIDDIYIHAEPIPIPQVPVLITNTGTISVKHGTPVNFNHVPFGANSSVIVDKKRTNAFLAPISQFLKSNPNFAITIFVGINLIDLNQVINMNGGKNNGTVKQLLWQRGQAIQRALLKMGVKPSQVVFAVQTGTANRISIVFR